MTPESGPTADTGETQSAAKPSAGTSSAWNRGKGFFEEKPGHRSMMRAMSLIALLAAVYFGWLSLIEVEGAEMAEHGIYITFGFLVAAFAPKALQKYAEGAIPAQ